ncbi:hypothetical protein [Pelagimonas varians]|uniref:Uncharacterized protein n=1 Tax=Pelagimonas varians TaxID=696760 RepID=A0A238KB22_9RHOB|nr:hypothetical protein [Pelagimonas varians]PYG31109.1 hypothetical protein C8N36_105167 [Pelagimonas varians]SMX39654.1 hypothetical protein PEV8663_01807 [Pelagimonas varians]
MSCLIHLKCLSTAAMLAVVAAPAMAMTDADNACIDALRATGTPDAQGGEILSSSFSEAGTLVMMKDAGGTTWRCIAYSDGAIGELSVDQAMDDGGAMPSAAMSGPQRVQFAPGTSGTAISGSLAANSSISYVIGAKDGQFLNVDVQSRGGALDYQILNPDGSALLDFIASDQPYKGQLWQSGDHVIEVLNAGAQPVSFDIGIGID